MALPIPRSQIASASLKKCRDCKLHLTSKINCLAGDGIKSSLMIVGESPKPTDYQIGQPFTGLDGAKLRYLLEKNGLDKNSIYCTYAIKCEMGKTKLSKEVTSACIHHLSEEIAWIKPKVILAIGTTALKMLLPHATTVDDMRGFPYPLNDQDGNFIAWVVPTFSLTKTIADPAADPIVIRDIAVAKNLIKNPILPRFDYITETINTLQRWKEVARQLYKAPSWAFDTETIGFNFNRRNGLLCFSFSIDGVTGYTLPFDHHFYRDGVLTRWTLEERAEILDILQKLFRCPSKKTAQNGKYDIKWLWAHNIEIANFDFDTMLAHHLLDGAKPHNLLFIGQWYKAIHEKYDLRLEQEKKRICAERKLKEDDFTYDLFDPNDLYHYAAIDAGITQRVRPLLENLLIKYGVDRVFHKISMPLCKLLADMEYKGAHINKSAMELIIADVRQKIIAATHAINTAMGITDFKPNATKPIAAFFVKHGVKSSKMTDTGNFSYDEEVLKKFTTHRNKKVADVCKKILELRELSKLKSTYLDGNDKDQSKGMYNQLDLNDYLHSTFNIHGTYCVAKGSKITSEIGDINIEDMVNPIKGFSPLKLRVKVWDGAAWRYPVAGYYSGICEGLEIKTKSRSLRATLIHPILVKIRHTYCWKRFYQLEIGDSAVIYRENGTTYIEKIESIEKITDEFFDLCMGDSGEDYLFFEDAEKFSKLQGWLTGKIYGKSASKRLIEQNKKNWHDPEYRKKMTKFHKIKAQKQHTNAKFVEKFRKSQKDYLEKMKGTDWMRLKNSKANKTKWKDPDYRKARSEFLREANISGKMGQVSPNKIETTLIEYIKDLPIRFTGGRQFWVRTSDNKAMNPDFKVNGKKAVIELFGDYWHRGENPQVKINRYARVGYKALIIWEHELKDLENVKKRILCFLERL